MDEKTEKAYSPKEMATTFDIGDSTLRKWCLALENNGYVFMRNENNGRVFTDSDLVILRHFQTLVKQYNTQLENAAMLVIDRFGKGVLTSRTGVVPAEKEVEQRSLERSTEDVIDTLLEHIAKQEKFNKELLDRLDQQQAYIEESIKRRDQFLLESLDEKLESRRMIAATEDSEPKKGFWSRLFNK